MAKEYPKGMVSATGQVKRPGVVGIKERLTLSGTIAQSGGLTRIARSRNNVKLERTDSDGKTIVRAFTLKKIVEGLAEDPELMNGDRVDVPEIVD